MSEQLKFIVSELNKPPFNKVYNLISFDSLDNVQLLQVLTDVIGEIDPPRQKVDVREETADQTAVRFFSSLRIFKYKPPADSEKMAIFRQGLVQGDKLVVYPILEWILQRLDELKKRAYLAKYLVRLEIPAEFMQDDDVCLLYQQYDEKIAQFTDLHRQATHLKSDGLSTNDVKKDIASMEDEKEQLLKRIERLRKKVDQQAKSGPMLAVARQLRQEKDREDKINTQKQEQKNAIVHADQRRHRLQNQLKDLQQSSVGATVAGLLQKLEEETRTNQYIVNDQLPKQLTSRKSAVQDLERVVNEPAMGQGELEQLKQKIRDVNVEISKLTETKMMTNDPSDKLALFRQQAAIIARKKEVAAETLQELREEIVRAEAELAEKNTIIKEQNGGEVLKGEEFKKYVHHLRSKSTVYKKKRQELHEIRAEHGVLSRTNEILVQRMEHLERHLDSVEAKKGVAGFRSTQDELEKVSALKSELDEMKGRTLEDMSEMVGKLNVKINEKKQALAPLIKELRPLRQQSQELSALHEQKKAAYESQSVGYESNLSKLEQEVKTLREELLSEESRYHYLHSMIKIMERQQQKINDEMKAYVSPDPQERKKSFREMYSKKIQEQENLGKVLREKQKSVRENQSTSVHQMKLWKDFQRLMECKQKCANSHVSHSPKHAAMRQVTSMHEADRLIL